MGAAQDRRRHAAHPDPSWLVDRVPRRGATGEPGVDGRQLCYSAGVMVLSKEHPHEIRYRSPEPVLSPVLPQERSGTIANVVFPTGIDRRDDLGTPDRFDVYYGMADNRIGVARLDCLQSCRREDAADPTEAAVSATFSLVGRLIRSVLRTREPRSART